MNLRFRPLIPLLLLASGLSQTQAAFDLEAWKTKYGTALTPAAFYSTRPGPWGDYFDSTGANAVACANASFLYLGPLGIKARPFDQALATPAFAALFPPALVDPSGLIQNSFGVMDTAEGAPSDGKVYPGDVILEIEQQRIKTASNVTFPMTVLAKDSRGLEIHAGQLVDVAEGRGAVKLKVLRASLSAYAGTTLTAPTTTAEVSISLTGQDFVRLTAVSDNGALTNWINPRFENGSGGVLYLNAQTIIQKSGFSSPQMGKDATGANVLDGATAVTNVIGTRNNSMIEYAVPAGYTTLKFKVQASGSGSILPSVRTRKATLATTPVSPRQFDVNGAPVLPPEVGPYLEEIEYTIPQIGSFGSGYDPNSEKVANYSAILAHRLAREQSADGSWPSGGGDYANAHFRTALAGLGLMATGDPAYATHIQKAATFVAANDPGGWAYPRGTRLMFLAEYYFRTRDATILPGLQKAVEDAEEMVLGDFTSGHGLNVGYGGAGYIGATGTIATGLAIASRTPARVDLPKLDDMLERIQELAGGNGGGLPYSRGGIGRNAFPETPSAGQTYSCGAGGVLATNIRGGPRYITELFRKKFGATADHGDVDGGHASEALTFIMGSLACAIWGDDAHKANMDTLLWRLTLKRDFAGYINLNTNRLEFHGGDGGVHGGPTYDTGGYLILLNSHKHNLAITGKPEAQAQVFPEIPPTYDVDRKLHMRVVSDWNMVEAALGSNFPASLQPKLAELRALPLGADLGTRVLAFLQREALAAATLVNGIAGLTTPEKQSYCEMLLGISHDITVGSIDNPVPSSGPSNYQFSLNGATAYSTWDSWGGPTLASDPAPSTQMTGTVTLTDPSGVYLPSPVVLNFSPANLDPTTNFQVPVTQQVNLTATFNYTVGGSLVINYTRSITVNPAVPFNVDARAGDYTNVRKVWIPGNCPIPFVKWNMPVQLPSGITLPGASKNEGSIGFYTYDNGTLVNADSIYQARIAGKPCGYWVTSGDRWGECAVLGVNLLPGPVLTTTNVSAITPTAATSGGIITSDSSWPVTQRGVCWSTSPYPTVFDSKTTNGPTIGTFTSSLSGLLPGTVYHVRAYAINAIGTSYGANVSFTTGGSSGTWTTNGGGSWPTTTNWLNGIDASGADGIADFGTVSPVSTATVTLDGNRSIGGMIFGNAGFTGNWVVSPGTGGSLSLDIGISGDPTVTVNGGTATLATVLTGTDGLIKAGPGNLVLSSTNLFTGITAVNAGTLQLSGSLSNGSPVSIGAAGTLSGTGTIGAATTVNGTLAPGIGGIGTLAFNNSLTLAGGVSMEINKTAATCDKVTGPTSLTYGGTLTVANLAGTLVAGDKFVLFTAGSYSGTFSAFTLPSLTAGLKWDTSGLLLDGSIQVGFDAAITGQPTNQSVGQGNTATFTVTATGLPSPSYQWQVSINAGGTWTNVSGATSASYTTPAVVSLDSGKQYRCVVFNSLSSVNSNAATLTVTANARPSFTTQPVNSVVSAAGQTATFTAAATGTPAPTLQWQVSTNNGGNWSNVSGATSGTYSFTTAAGDDNKLYRCVASNTQGGTNSNTAQLLIAPIPTWTNPAGGSWTTAANWFNNTIANGTGITADFSRLNLSAPAVVTLDGARTIGNLRFGTPSGTNGWTLNTGTGGPLTLAVSSGSPTLTVSSNSATLNTVLAGTNGLTKAGAGTLVLNASNTYTGGTTLSAGQLNLNSANALAGGALIITGGAIGNSSGSTVTLAGAQTWNGNFSCVGPNNLILSGNVALGGNRTVTVNGGDLTLNGVVSGAFSLTKQGANTLTVSQGNTYSGGTIVSAGKLVATGGGWYSNRSIGTGALTVNSGATAQFTASHGFGVDPGGRSATINGGTLQFDRENYMSGLTMTGGSVTGGGEIRFNANLTVPINSSTTGSIIANGINLVSGTTTFNVANGAAATDLLISGGIYGSTSMVKSGAGFMKLTGSGSYAGTTSISAGTLQLAGGSLGGGNVTVASTATLAGSGSIGGSTTVNGLLVVGVDGATGTIGFSNNLTLASTSQTTMRLKKTGSTLSNDLLTGINTLTCGGTLTVTASGDALAAGDNFQLFSATTFSGTFTSVTLPTLAGGLTWDTSRLYIDGSISLGKKPQSITFGSLPAVAYGALLPLNASATSGLPVSYSSSNPAVAIVQFGNDLTAVGTGTTTITASQPGSTAFLPATNVSQTLVVGASVPAVSTVAPILLSNSTASSGGVNIWDGGDTVTERGVCWSTSVDPTVASSRTIDGSGTGSFTSTLTGLTASTTYYLRAYAKNSAGYGYGTTLTLVTPSPVVTGVWTNLSGGSWPTTGNWQSGGVPTSIGSTANFGTLNITAARTVTLDSTVTLSGLTFGDTNNTHGWTLNTGTSGSLSMNTFTGSPSIAVTNQTTTINAPIGGTSGLIKTGAGTLVLGATNTFTGPVSFQGGIVRQGVNTALASAIDLTITNAVLEVRYGLYNVNWIDAQSLTLGGGATLRAASQYAVDNGDIGFKDTINVIGTNTVSATGGSYGKHNWLSGGMTGDSAAVVNLSNGAGYGAYADRRAIILESAFGNWTGYLGTIRAVNDVTIKGTVELRNAKVIVDGTIGLYSNASIGEFGELSGAGTLEANAKTGSEWKVGNLGTSSTFSGVINGATKLTKVGTGALTLTNASTHTDGVVVSAGTLLANNTTGSATGTGAVSVSAPATLGGTGSVGGALTVNGSLAPGNNGVGNLTAASSVTLSPNSSIAWQISNWTGTSGTGFDKLTAASLILNASAANPVTIRISEQALANFTETSRTFLLAQTTSGISGFDASEFVIDKTGIPTAKGTWAVQQSGNDLVLAYTRGNTAPAFQSNPIALAATQGTTVSSSLLASDPESDPLTFSKLSGPSWLGVSTTGVLSGTPGNSEVGLNSFSVQVTDSLGASSTATLNVTVANVNDAPTFSSGTLNGAGGTQGQGYSGSLGGTASDVDAGDTLTYSKIVGPAWLSIASNGALTGTPGNANVGPNSFTVRVTDAAGLFAQATLSITVTNVNDAPTFPVNPVILSAAEDSAFTGQLAASDVDAGDTLTYTKLTGPAWLTVSSSGALGGTPANGDVGPATATVQVKDAANATASVTLSITVTNVNDAPIFPVNPVILSATEDSAFTGQLAASDIDAGDTLTYTKLTGPTWLTVSTTGALGGTPANADVGPATATVQVKDAANATASVTLSITISNVNDVPTFPVNPVILSATEDSAFTGQLAASDSDAGDTLTYTKLTGPAWLTVSSSGALGGTPANGDVGPATATVQVKDTANATASVTLSITIANVNDVPSFPVNPVILNATEDSAFSGQLAASDVDAGDTLTYTKLTGPAWLTVSSTGALGGTPANDDVGPATATVEVKDASNATASVTLSITVTNVNDVPTFPVNPVILSATEDSAFTGQLAASDIDAGDTLTYTKLTGPAWLTVSTSGALGGTPANDDVGPATATVEVKDASNATASVTLSITIANVNDVPSFPVNPVILNATEDSAFSGQLSAADIDAGDTLTYTKLTGPAWLTVSSSGALGGTPTNGDVGPISATVEAKDAANATATATLSITVTNVNDAPSFSSGTFAGGGATEDQVYAGSLSGTASDIDSGDSLTYSKMVGPAWLSVASNGALTGTPGNADVGSNSFTVRATDASGLYSEATLTISVSNVNDEPTFPVNPVILSATEDSAFTGQLAASDVDAGDTFTYTKLTGPAWLTVSSSGALGGTPANDDVGPVTATVEVKDASNATASATLSITVTNVNDVPSFPVNQVILSATEDSAFSGQLSAADIDAGDTLTYTKLTGPAWLTVSTSGALGGTPANDDVGPATATVEVKDASNATASVTLSITVTNVNDVPIFIAGLSAADATQDQAYSGSVAGTVSDVDSGDSLTFSKASGPSWLNVAANGVLSGTPGSGNVGTNSFTIRITDAAGLFAEAPLTLSVIASNPDANGNGILDAWETQQFGNAASGNNAANDDADQDGLSNLLEFALGTNPLVTGANPILHDQELVGADRHLRMTIPKNPAATNLSYIVEVCENLAAANWSAVPTVIESETATQLIVRDSVPMSAAPHRFMRLRVRPLP